MATLNQCNFIGRLGKDPEFLVTANGNPYTRFSLAVGSGSDTQWFNCTAWEKLAEIVEQYGKKGMQVFVSGRLVLRPWIGKDGSKNVSPDLTVLTFQMLDKRDASPVPNHDENEGEQPA